MSRILLMFIIISGCLGNLLPCYAAPIHAPEWAEVSEYFSLQPEEVWLTPRGILFCREGCYYKVDCIKHLGNGRYEINGIKYLSLPPSPSPYYDKD